MLPKPKRAKLDSTVEPDLSSSSELSDSESESSSVSKKTQDEQQPAEELKKPDASYIELIAMAILEAPGHKVHLQDIYESLERKYPYFQVAKPSWRNNVRHNLSLHDCFCKLERCESGKGHYWSIHPANLQDFLNGDFRRSKIHSKSRSSAIAPLNSPCLTQEHSVFTPAPLLPPLSYSLSSPSSLTITPTAANIQDHPLVPLSSCTYFVPLPCIQSYPSPPPLPPVPPLGLTSPPIPPEVGYNTTASLPPRSLSSTVTITPPIKTTANTLPNKDSSKKQTLAFSVKNLLSN